MFVGPRRVGIAIGSLFMAALAVSFVGGVAMFVIDPGHPVLGPGAREGVAAIPAIVTILLGGLIYRDIIRREAGRD